MNKLEIFGQQKIPKREKYIRIFKIRLESNLSPVEKLEESLKSSTVICSGPLYKRSNTHFESFFFRCHPIDQVRMLKIVLSVFRRKCICKKAFVNATINGITKNLPVILNMYQIIK